MTAELAVHTTAIPGLLVIDLPVHGDDEENLTDRSLLDIALATGFAARASSGDFLLISH